MSLAPAAASTKRVVLEYLQQHGYREAEARAAETTPREVKLQELVNGDGQRRSVRLGLHVHVPEGSRYDDGYRQLVEWIGTRPPAVREELRRFSFPMLAHCFLAMVGRGEAAAAAAMLKAYASEARSSPDMSAAAGLSNVKQVQHLCEEEAAKTYLSSRVSVTCSSEAFEALCTFLSTRNLLLLIRILYKYFNVHTVGRCAQPLPTEAHTAPAAAPGAAAAAAAAPPAAASEVAAAAASVTLVRSPLSQVPWGSTAWAHSQQDELAAPTFATLLRSCVCAAAAAEAAAGQSSGRDQSGGPTNGVSSTAAASPGRTRAAAVDGTASAPASAAAAAGAAAASASAPDIGSAASQAAAAAAAAGDPSAGGRCGKSSPDSPTTAAAAANDAAPAAATTPPSAPVAAGGAPAGAVRIGTAAAKQTAQAPPAASLVGAAASHTGTPAVAAASSSTAVAAVGAAIAAAGPPSFESSSLPSICLLELHTSHGQLCCSEINPAATGLACGQADGSIAFCRFSRAEVLQSRWRAGIPEQTTLSSRHHVQPAHAGPVYSCAFSADSKLLLSSSQDGCVRLWSWHRAACLASYHNHGYPVWSSAFASHSNQFLSGCYDGIVRLFHTERRMPMRVMAGHLSDVYAARFHPNDAYALSASADGTLRLWDVCSAACVRLLRGHAAAVRDVVAHPEGAYAASASDDGTLVLWHLASGRSVATLQTDEPLTRVVFSNNGRLLAAASASQLCLWDFKAVMKGGDPNPSPLIVTEATAPVLTATFVPQLPLLLAVAEQHVECGIVPDIFAAGHGVVAGAWHSSASESKRPRV